MKHAYWTGLLWLLCTGCFDWTGEYAKATARLGDAGAAGGGLGGASGGGSSSVGGSGGSGGGNAVGGGAGGGGGAVNTGGGGGGSGGGVSTGGGSSGGGSAAGGGGNTVLPCASALCAQDELMSTHTAELAMAYPVVAPGLLAASTTNWVAYASFDTQGVNKHFELRRASDGGLQEVDRSGDFFQAEPANTATGTVNDAWFVSSSFINHYVNGVRQDHIGETFVKVDGGSDSMAWWGAFRPPSGDMLLFGHAYEGLGICRWTPDAGARELVDDALLPGGYAYQAYETPSGRLFIAGVLNDGSNYNSHIFLRDGGVASSPSDVDPGDYGFRSIGGVGEEVWAVSNTGLIVKRQNATSDAFVEVHRAGYTLRSLAVRAANDIWAVGNQGNQALHFNGTAWSVVVLPLSQAQPDIVWEQVVGTTDGIVLSGHKGSQNAFKAVIHSYRTMGH